MLRQMRFAPFSRAPLGPQGMAHVGARAERAARDRFTDRRGGLDSGGAQAKGKGTIMQITWLGHSGFRIEVEGAVLLVDPWLSGNPMFPKGRRDAAVAGATHILLTHAHHDHSADAVGLAKALKVPLVGIYDLMGWLEQKEGIATIGFNRGGTVDLAGAKVTLVAASHSSSIGTKDGPLYAGSECGFMIAGGG
ncbi:MAG: hypothetical protein RIR62_1037, partial [Pseudomonadota bacterium]